MSLVRRFRAWLRYLQDDVIRDSSPDFKFFLVVVSAGTIGLVLPLLGAARQGHHIHNDQSSLILLWISVALAALAVVSALFVTGTLLTGKRSPQKN